MSNSELPPVEDGAEEEGEEDADAAEELHEATKESLQLGPFNKSYSVTQRQWGCSKHLCCVKKIMVD